MKSKTGPGGGLAGLFGRGMKAGLNVFAQGGSTASIGEGAGSILKHAEKIAKASNKPGGKG